ncbi:MAG: hypothetical protein JSR91_00850 [Proteobacteria bacterium]|nr:hypothetical protein [Pseudomonadota bacterium]
MHNRHLPAFGRRFWIALCFASIWGANLGDFFAHVLGLGHLKGLPFLAAALGFILMIERFDRFAHEAWYWAAIVVVRTAATNVADLFCGDLRLPRLRVSVALALALTIAVALVWSAWRRSAGRGTGIAADRKRLILSADSGYWFCMLLAGTLGTMLGDYASHDLHLGDAKAAVVLSLPLACLFAAGGRGRLWLPGFYWVTVVMVRATGTAVGDLFAQRGVLGLSLSTVVTGIAFVLMLLIASAHTSRVTSWEEN